MDIWKEMLQNVLNVWYIQPLQTRSWAYNRDSFVLKNSTLFPYLMSQICGKMTVLAIWMREWMYTFKKDVTLI